MAEKEKVRDYGAMAGARHRAGSNGNSIFLHFTGYMKKSTLTDNEYAAYFGSAAAISSSTTTAYYFMSDAGYEVDTTMLRNYVCRFAQ